MMMKNAAMLALPLLAAVACSGRYQSSATPDPTAVSRDSQVEACANNLAKEAARPRADIRAFYDRDGYNGNAMVTAAGPTGTFQCEVDNSLNVVRMSRVSGETPAAG